MPPWWAQGKVSSGLSVAAFPCLKETGISAAWFYPIFLSQANPANPLSKLQCPHVLPAVLWLSPSPRNCLPNGSCLWLIHLNKEIYVFLPQPCTSPVFPTALTPYHLFPFPFGIGVVDFSLKEPTLSSLLSFALWISSCFTHLSKRFLILSLLVLPLSVTLFKNVACHCLRHEGSGE